MDSRTKVCLFVGYPKGIIGGLFYSPQDKKVFVSTNATFLENDYVTNFKPCSKVVLEELRRDVIVPQPTKLLILEKKRTLHVLLKTSHYLDVVGGL